MPDAHSPGRVVCPHQAAEGLTGRCHVCVARAAKEFAAKMSEQGSPLIAGLFERTGDLAIRLQEEEGP